MANNSIINEQQSNRDRLKREEDEKNAAEQSEREKNSTVCVCSKCKGTGELWAKQLATWEINNGTDKYGNTKTIKQTGYTNQYFSICPKCLGDGKCH